MANHPFDTLVQYAADILATRLSGVIGGASRKAAKGNGTAAKGRRSSALKGKKLDMSCRVAGCKNTSGGPRHGFMCEQHQKLPKKQQEAAREAWKAQSA